MRYIDPCGQLTVTGLSKSEVVSIDVSIPPGNYIKRATVITTTKNPPQQLGISYAGELLINGELAGVSYECETTTAFYMSQRKIDSNQQNKEKIFIIPKSYANMIADQERMSAALNGVQVENYSFSVELLDTYSYRGTTWADMLDVRLTNPFADQFFQGQNYVGLGLWIVVRDVRFPLYWKTSAGTVLTNLNSAKPHVIFTGYNRDNAYFFTDVDTVDDLLSKLMLTAGINNLRININSLPYSITELLTIDTNDIERYILNMLSVLKPVYYIDEVTNERFVVDDIDKIRGKIIIPESFIRNKTINTSTENIPGKVKVVRGRDQYIEFLEGRGIVIPPSVVLETGINSAVVDEVHVNFCITKEELIQIATRRAKWYRYYQSGSITTIAPLPAVKPYTKVQVGGDVFVCNSVSHHFSHDDAYTTISLGGAI
ncbi:hypothetical protein [Hydrogenobacter thermophilus]|uniref:hypothetical protein n=1 Tax=Hydrogenobacter thermophilus TaxID=940 RepID=UPI0030FA6403